MEHSKTWKLPIMPCTVHPHYHHKSGILNSVLITSHNKPDGFFLFSLKELTSETNLKAGLIRPQDSVPHRFPPFQELRPTDDDSSSRHNLLVVFILHKDVFLTLTHLTELSVINVNICHQGFVELFNCYHQIQLDRIHIAYQSVFAALAQLKRFFLGATEESI